MWTYAICENNAPLNEYTLHDISRRRHTVLFSPSEPILCCLVHQNLAPKKRWQIFLVPTKLSKINSIWDNIFLFLIAFVIVCCYQNSFWVEHICWTHHAQEKLQKLCNSHDSFISTPFIQRVFHTHASTYPCPHITLSHFHWLWFSLEISLSLFLSFAVSLFLSCSLLVSLHPLLCSLTPCLLNSLPIPTVPPTLSPCLLSASLTPFPPSTNPKEMCSWSKATEWLYFRENNTVCISASASSLVATLNADMQESSPSSGWFMWQMGCALT